MSSQIGFIGAGQMARALAKGFVDANLVKAQDVHACDPSRDARDGFWEQIPGATLGESGLQLVDASDIVFLATKPQKLGAVFAELQTSSKDVLFVSIAAGVSLKRLCEGLGTRRVIRVMPNTPCLVGAGAAAYSHAGGATPQDRELVDQLLSSVAVVESLPESMLDGVTGLSGSGPAFVYQFIEALSDGGVRVGLPRAVALKLAAQTVLGAAKMVLETGHHPGELKDQVTSPGGTTIAGLHVLESGAMRATLMDAVASATERSKELGAAEDTSTKNKQARLS